MNVKCNARANDTTPGSPRRLSRALAALLAGASLAGLSARAVAGQGAEGEKSETPAAAVTEDAAATTAGAKVAGAKTAKASEASDDAAAPVAGGRTKEEIDEDRNRVSDALGGSLFAGDLGDERFVARVAPKAVPLLKELVALLEEAKAQEADPMVVEDLDRQRYQTLGFLSLLGDEETAERLEEMSRSDNVSDAAGARAVQVMVDWLRTGQDVEAQEAVLRELEALAEEHATEQSVAGVATLMSNVGAASKDLSRRAYELSVKLATAKVMALEGKPLVIEGRELGGEHVSTASWKGKVILVDFWATWCQPCVESLPRLSDAYEKYHDQGLEILAVSCDESEEELSDFLLKRVDMPWPQLFDPKGNAERKWHPVGRELGVNSLPTLFLIDRKGVVRTVEAHENFEELIPQLLAEEVGDETGEADADAGAGGKAKAGDAKSDKKAKPADGGKAEAGKEAGEANADEEAAAADAQEHESTIRSPSSTLSVRG